MRYLNQLNAVLEEIVARWGIPGLGVGIVQEGEIVYAKGFGVQSLTTGVPVTPESIFCVASITKCFVATAVMQLAERGQIDLDTPLVHYLPYFQLDDARYLQITPRLILSHTSGMPDLDEDEYDELLYHPEYDDGAAERYVRGLGHRKMIAAPGERFAYSNIAYNVLGDLIAKVSGQSFEAYMKAQILLPAGMPASTLLLSEVAQDRLAVPHLRVPEMMVNPTYPYHRADAPASFLHSTVIDMCHWAITSLDQGRDPAARLLSPSGYEKMWTPVAEWGYPPLYEHIGLGWTLGHFEGLKTVSHGGMGFGWTDFITLLPEKRRGAIVLCNEESWARTRSVYAALNTMLDQEPRANPVSWMVPVSRALQERGVAAAYTRATEIRDGNGEEYYCDADDLPGLAIQMTSAGKPDRAVEVLGLNLHEYPEHIDSYLQRARIYMRLGEGALAEQDLLSVLLLEPNHPAAMELLEKVRSLKEI